MIQCKLFRGQAGMPCGLISNLGLSQAQHLTLLFPKEKNVPDLEYREMHQVSVEMYLRDVNFWASNFFSIDSKT